MTQYGLLIDYEYCTGCNSCVIACKEEHDYPVGKWGIRVFDNGPWQKTTCRMRAITSIGTAFLCQQICATCAQSAWPRARNQHVCTIV